MAVFHSVPVFYDPEGSGCDRVQIYEYTLALLMLSSLVHGMIYSVDGEC